MVQALLNITGRVQGVFYRAGCEDEANKLGLTGYAKNLDDGDVEVLLQGEKWQIEDFIKWASKGSPSAKVDNIETNWGEINGKKEKFEIY